MNGFGIPFLGCWRIYSSIAASRSSADIFTRFMMPNLCKFLSPLKPPGIIFNPFAPIPNLGLIIVDEEHEQSYKQFDPAPRYHARDTAVVLANLFKAKTLLGSATPSIESYFNAVKEKKYGFAELKTRYNDVLMPEIELVDIKDKHKRKRMQGHFSDRLIEEMMEALNDDNQIILFQNRRGFSPIIECNTCGHSPQCPNCDVSLTYHQYKNQLRFDCLLRHLPHR